VEGSSGLSVAPGVSRRFWKHGSLICLRVCVTILCKKNKYSVFLLSEYHGSDVLSSDLSANDNFNERFKQEFQCATFVT